MKNKQKIIIMDPNDIRLGPQRNHDFTEDQLNKMKHIHNVLSEVYPKSLEKWIEDFDRDAHPDREIAIFKALADTYSSIIRYNDLSQAHKKALFRILFLCTIYPDKSVLHYAQTDLFSPDEIRSFIGMYRITT